MSMEEILEKLTDYTFALKDSLDVTSEANERSLLARHLAVAAEIYALLHKHQNVSAIESIVKTEIRGHGWSFISGDAGTKVANTWMTFTNASGIKY